MELPAVLLGLLEDACLSSAGDVARGVAAHHEQRDGPYAPLLGPLRVPDSRLSRWGASRVTRLRYRCVH